MEEVILGIGSNTDNAMFQCERAVELLKEREVVDVAGISSWYITEPQGYRNQNWFINGVICGITLLSPRELLEAIKKIETDMGRRQTFRWGPRVIDIDILFYGHNGGICVNEEDLYIPHRMLHERRFVLVPLVEIAPFLVHPVYHQNIRTLLKRLTAKGQKVKRAKRR